MVARLEITPIIIGHASTERSALEESYIMQLSQGLFAFTSFRGVGYKHLNEDRIIILPQIPLFCVIDGLGGPGDGARAAEIFTEELSKLRDPNSESLSEVQKQVSIRIEDECRTPNSGVCFALFWIAETTLKVYHLGDVKFALLNHENQIKWESRDHTLLNAWVDQGFLSAEETTNHPKRHIVTKALTGYETPNPEIQQISFVPGDRVIVASDGLWDNFMIDEITVMLADSNPQAQVRQLMRKAVRKMQQNHSAKWEGLLVPKPDNISILIGSL